MKGGNGQRRYEEGWIEFVDKNLAKFVALTFNGQQMGGKKADRHHDDIWALRYLSGFKWEHLVKIGFEENITRKKKLNKKVQEAKKEHDEFLSRADRAQQVRALLRKKAARILEEEGGDPKDEERLRTVISERLLKKK